MSTNSDDNFAKYVLQTGMATDAQIAHARQRLTDGKVQGAGTLSEVMVREGIITTAQRETVEKKLRTQTAGIQQLDSYKLIKKLGEGGMGVVYLAEDTVAYRKVALKVLSRKYAANPEFLGRFRREAQALGRLNHPNIVAGFNVGEDKGYQYYVMEFCEGEPLDKRLKREKKLSISDAIDVVTQVARGLQYAHERNTIHRDIKPGNIFAMTDGTIKILDMGLSKTIGETDSSFNTQAGVTVGTPHYISPEQARGEQSVDGRADIYSLGATLYHFITGSTPFEGPTSAVIMTKHLNDQLPNPSDLRPDCPEGLEQIITRMMAKKADDRYLNCAELIEDLEQVAQGKSPSSPALDPIHSSVGMRSLRVGTGKFKPVGAEREATAHPEKQNVRRTGKRDPVTGSEKSGEAAPSSSREKTAGRSGRLPANEAEPLFRDGDARINIAKVGTGKQAPVSDRAEPLAPPSAIARRSTGKQIPIPDRQEPRAEPAIPASTPITAAPVPAPAPETAPVAAEAVVAMPVSAGAGSGPKKQVIGILIAAAVVLAAIGLYVAFSSKSSVVVVTSTESGTSVAVAPAPNAAPTPPVTTQTRPSQNPQIMMPASIPVINSSPVITQQPTLAEAAGQLEMLIRQRNFPRARERLEQLERDVADRDTYNVAWCSRLDGYDRGIVNGELTLRQEFKKQLIGNGEIGSLPAAAVVLFSATGSDPRVKWSPRTIKFFTGKLPWVDGLGDSKVMTFEASDNLLSPGPHGRITFEYSGTVDCDATIKFLTSDDKWKEVAVSLPPGRLRKVDVSPGAQLFNGMFVSKMSIELNSQTDALALYRIYIAR
jgi:serine/threonine protein kinase